MIYDKVGLPNFFSIYGVLLFYLLFFFSISYHEVFSISTSTPGHQRTLARITSFFRLLANLCLLFPIMARDSCKACKACDLHCMPPLYASAVMTCIRDATLFLLSDSSMNSYSDSLFALLIQEKLEFLKSV